MKNLFRNLLSVAAMCAAPVAAIAANPTAIPTPEPAGAPAPLPQQQIGVDQAFCQPQSYCPPVCEPCGPTSYGSVGVMFLERSQDDNFHLTIQNDCDSIWLETDDLEYEHEVAPLVTFGHWIDKCTAIEATYWGVSHDADAQSAPDLRTGVNGPFLGPYFGVAVASGFNLDSFQDSYLHTTSNESDLHNFEINFRRGASIWNSYYAGIRYMYLEEHFNWTSHKTQADPRVFGSYDIDTYNHMVGPQIGGSAARSVTNNCIIGLNGSAGILANFARQNNRIFSRDANVQHANDSEGAEDVDLTTIVQAGLFTGYTVSDSLALQLGYNLIALNGVAVATGQLDSAPNRTATRDWIGTNNDLFYHGPSASAVFLW